MANSGSSQSKTASLVLKGYIDTPNPSPSSAVPSTDKKTELAKAVSKIEEERRETGAHF